MEDVAALFIRIAADTEPFIAALKSAAAALDRFADVIGNLVDHRPLSGAGSLAYRFATWIGFATLDVLAWLETCPGAFADEFADGWKN